MARLQLPIDKIESLRKALKDKYDRTKNAEEPLLTINKSSMNYVGLAEAIKQKTGIRPSENWLMTFFNYSPEEDNEDKEWQTGPLDACCSYVSGITTTAEKYLVKGLDPVQQILGRFNIYWTGSVQNKPVAIYTSGMILDLQEPRSLLYDDDGDIYEGGPPVIMGGKTYINVINETTREQVNFILHVSDVKREDLDYIPGIFSAGDRSNIYPCCGPVLLVREAVKTPNSGLLDKYFQNFHGNNLIRSWIITDVLAELENQKIEETGPVSTLAGKADYDAEARLSLYLNQKFFLYYWSGIQNNRQEEGRIGRGIMTIGKDRHSVRIHSAEGNKYAGSIELLQGDYLSLHLKVADTSQKDLSIKLKTGHKGIPQYALGIYSNITDDGAIIAGTILLEHYDEERMPGPFEPRTFLQAEGEGLSPYILRYFNDKQKNHLRVPSSGILSDKFFEKFFREQQQKLQAKAPLSAGNNIFIATPMSANVEEFENSRETVIEIQKHLAETYQTNVYYAGKEYSPDVGFTYAYLAAEQDFQELDKASMFLLIHPMKIASSTLIELGWALAQKKRCIIFYRNREDLPFLVRELRDSNVRFIRYTDQENLLATIKKLGNRLFP